MIKRFIASRRRPVVVPAPASRRSPLASRPLVPVPSATQVAYPPASASVPLGANVVGLEGGPPADVLYGPVRGREYPALSTRLVDYLASRGMTMLRLLFSWERLTGSLGGAPGQAPSGAPSGSGQGYREYLATMKEVVNHATSRGMHVVLEPWQSSASGGVGGLSWRGRVLSMQDASVMMPQPSVEADLVPMCRMWASLVKIFAGNERVHYGLVNEPNGVSTMAWFKTAQRLISAIRGAGARTPIHVPGNGWTGAGSWTQDWYDSAYPRWSNAHGWKFANGMGMSGSGVPLTDPLGKLLAEVHLYATEDGGGASTQIASPSVLVDRLRVAVDAARKGGYKVFVGEVGLYAGSPGAALAWQQLRSYVNANKDVVAGMCWWAAGDPEWWKDPAADGGGHFSISPTDPRTFAGDTVNMRMISSG